MVATVGRQVRLWSSRRLGKLHLELPGSYCQGLWSPRSLCTEPGVPCGPGRAWRTCNSPSPFTGLRTLLVRWPPLVPKGKRVPLLPPLASDREESVLPAAAAPLLARRGRSKTRAQSPRRRGPLGCWEQDASSAPSRLIRGVCSSSTSARDPGPEH